MSTRSLELKQRLRAGEVTMGAWLSIASPVVAEMMAGAGFDWILIDTEHCAFGSEGLQTVLMAFNGRQTVPIVRVPSNDPVRIKLVLDLGADGVMVPMVMSAAEAQLAVAACKYPPAGIRGYHPLRATDYYRAKDAYMSTANESLIVAIMIEHAQAVDSIDDILDVPGIDVVCLGPMDLSGSLGLLGQLDHPSVVAAIERVAEAAHRRGIPVSRGMPFPPDVLVDLAVKGDRFIIVTADYTILRHGARAALTAVQEGIRRRRGR